MKEGKKDRVCPKMTITISLTSHVLLTTQLTSLWGGVWVVYVPPLESECMCDRFEWQSMVKILPCVSQWSISILVWFVVRWQSQEPWDNSVLRLYPSVRDGLILPGLVWQSRQTLATSVGSPPGKHAWKSCGSPGFYHLEMGQRCHLWLIIVIPTPRRVYVSGIDDALLIVWSGRWVRGCIFPSEHILLVILIMLFLGNSQTSRFEHPETAVHSVSVLLK